MSFITQGKTNWKFLLIVAIIASAVGGGIWWYTKQNLPISQILDIKTTKDIKYCEQDSDCKYTCGCGAINKNEICHDEGATYDCVNHEVRCENNICITGEEIIGGINETAGWQTYRNEEYGFEVKYPDSWTAKEDRSLMNGLSISFMSPENFQKNEKEKPVLSEYGDLFVNIKEDFSFSSAKDWLNWYYKNLSTPPSYDEVIVNGVLGISFISPIDNSRELMFIKNNFAYNLMVSIDSESTHQILSTFRFIE